jgi:hypothetical protein
MLLDNEGRTCILFFGYKRKAPVEDGVGSGGVEDSRRSCHKNERSEMIHPPFYCTTNLPCSFKNLVSNLTKAKHTLFRRLRPRQPQFRLMRRFSEMFKSVELSKVCKNKRSS